MDYIGVKRLDETGNVAGEYRFLGLFTSKAYTENAETIPILRRKLDDILSASSSSPGSHDYKEIITIFNSMPKEDLFQASREELEKEVQTVLSLLFSDDVHVTLRPDPLRRGVTVMVVLPRGKFSGEVRQRIQEMLTQRFGGAMLNYHLALSAGDQARLHFFLTASPSAVEQADAAELERETARIIRSWEDQLLDALAAVHGRGRRSALPSATPPHSAKNTGRPRCPKSPSTTSPGWNAWSVRTATLRSTCASRAAAGGRTCTGASRSSSCTCGTSGWSSRTSCRFSTTPASACSR